MNKQVETTGAYLERWELMENYENKLESFVAGCQDKIDADRNEHFPNIPRIGLRVASGRRYSKLITTEARGEGVSQKFIDSSVFAFIDKTSGDVLKAASWASPAKHARGNIFDEFNGLKYVTAYGPVYLTR
jgi:hypothetical protein